MNQFTDPLLQTTASHLTPMECQEVAEILERRARELRSVAVSSDIFLLHQESICPRPELN